MAKWIQACFISNGTGVSKSREGDEPNLDALIAIAKEYLQLHILLFVHKPSHFSGTKEKTTKGLNWASIFLPASLASLPE